MAKKTYKFEPDYAVPPGNTLLETLEHLNISQAEFAERTGRPKKTINGIIKGKIAITAETALQFEKVLGVPASFWLNLEFNYQEAKARLKEKEEIEKHRSWLERFPIKEMVNHGWIKECADEVEYSSEILSFFGVASPAAWHKHWYSPEAAYRKSKAFETYPEALAVWLRKGEIEAQKIQCTPFNRNEFKEVLKEIRSLTITSPEIFQPKMIELCNKAGVVLVFVKEIPKCPVSGAARWLSPNKALIQMSLRYKSDDHFWFTFFHEAGHILRHNKREIFIDTDEQIVNKKEDEANQFARDFLIPKHEFERFLQLNPRCPISYKQVELFAKRIGIAPGIVVGRLQHDGEIPYTHLNRLKRKFEWAE